MGVHNAFTIVITILQRMLWLVLYSSVAGQTTKDTGIENYTAFILPGLMLLVSFGTCSSSGIMNYLMKADGSFYRVLIVPICRSSIVLGQLLEAVLCTFLKIGILMLVSLFFSVKIPTSTSVILNTVVLVFLAAFFMAGLCYGISLLFPNEVMYETVMNAIVLPVFFLSTAIFPANSVTGVLGAAISLNPFTHVINALRSLIVYGRIDIMQIVCVMAMFVALDCISFAWAHFRLKKKEI